MERMLIAEILGKSYLFYLFIYLFASLDSYKFVNFLKGKFIIIRGMSTFMDFVGHIKLWNVTFTDYDIVYRNVLKAFGLTQTHDLPHSKRPHFNHYNTDAGHKQSENHYLTTLFNH